MLYDALSVRREELVVLWAGVFGDPPALAERFLEELPSLGFGVAAAEDGHVLGAAYGVDAFSVQGERCLYLYAVAVAPEHRGKGLGAALSRAVFERGEMRGARYRCTEPAEPSLFDWYGRILGVKPVLWRQERAIVTASGLPVRSIEAAEYCARREALLKAAPHVAYTPAMLRFEATSCALSGGGLYTVGEGLAAAYRAEGKTVVRECLGPEPERQAAALGALLGSESVLLRCSGDAGTPLLAGDRPLPPGTAWDLTLD